MLTDQQQTHWHTFGFVTFRNLFTETEVETIHDEFEAGLATEQTNYSDGELPISFSGLGSSTPFLSALPEDPRFLEAAEQIWGDDVISSGSMGQRFTNSNTYWHPDLVDGSHETKDNHIPGVKFACYLDALKPDSGALRLIPGSHMSPLHDELFAIGLKGDESPYLKKAGVTIRDIPAYVWASDPTDVIAFNNRLWHASWGGSDDRRQVNVMYYKNASNSKEEDLTREYVDLTRKTLPEKHGPMYPEYWLNNPADSPTRRRWIDWLNHYGFLN